MDGGNPAASHPVPVYGASGTGFCLSELSLRAVLSGPRSTLTLRWAHGFSLIPLAGDTDLWQAEAKGPRISCSAAYLDLAPSTGRAA